MGQRASDTRGITFEDVVVPDENRLGDVGVGFKVHAHIWPMASGSSSARNADGRPLAVVIGGVDPRLPWARLT